MGRWWCHHKETVDEKMKCEGSKSENELSPWWVSDDRGLRRDGRNPAAFAPCQPGNLVEKCCQIVYNGSCSISFPFKASVSRNFTELLEESVCPQLRALTVLITFYPFGSWKAIPTFQLFSPERCFSPRCSISFLIWKRSHLLAKGHPYIIGKINLIDFSVSFRSLISIHLIDAFLSFWSFFPSFAFHMNISSGLSTLFTFSCVIRWNL